MDPRLARARPETERPYAAAVSRSSGTDLERIRFARSFSRLAEVTQVITAGATSGVVHNRLTHTIKVTAVARAIAVRLLRTERPRPARATSAVSTMWWSRPRPALTTSGIRPSGTSASGCWTGWPGSGSG